MSPNDNADKPLSGQIDRRSLLSIGAGATVAGLGTTLFTGSAYAWKRFDVDFRSETTVWMIVGDDLDYEPPAVTHVIVDTGDEVTCRLVEFTEAAATKKPDMYGDYPVVPYTATDGTVLGVLPYNRPLAGNGRFSRPRCVMVNPKLDVNDPLSRVDNADCVSAAKTSYWDGDLRTCWFDPLDAEKPDDNEIDSCRTITEPGEYELVTDLSADNDEPCLEILAEGVTIHGNGHTIDGSGIPTDSDSPGILSDAVSSSPGSGKERDPVRIHNLTVTGWQTGIAATNYEYLSVEDCTITHNEFGIDLGVDTSGTRLDVTNCTIEYNDDHGIHSLGFHDISVLNSTIQYNTTGIGLADSEFELENSVVSNNDETGIATSDGVTNILASSITGNQTGISHRFANLEFEDTTVSDNQGREIDVFTPPAGDPGSSIRADNLGIGSYGTLDMDSGNVTAIDTIQQSALPALPGDATAAGDGLEVFNFSGPADLGLEFTADPAEVELWRHDGTDWTTLPDSTVDNGTVEAEIDAEGIYAPVVP